jgi:hypothetical protein
MTKSLVFEARSLNRDTFAMTNCMTVGPDGLRVLTRSILCNDSMQANYGCKSSGAKQIDVGFSTMLLSHPPRPWQDDSVNFGNAILR